MQVWRIEDEYGIGPHSDAIVAPLVAHTHSNEPHSKNDFNKQSVNILGGKFGFKSLDQMVDWYTIKTIDDLFKIGFIIKNYEAAEYVVSNSYTYVIFNRFLSTEKYSINDIRELFKVWL